MVRVAQVVEALGGLRRRVNLSPSLLSSKWDVSDSLWRRIEQFSRRDHSQKNPHELLLDLFELGQNSPQRALIGSLMAEQGLRLPIVQEIRWIRALMAEARPHDALEVWMSRKNPPMNNQNWVRTGVEILIACNRLADAERLVTRRLRDLRTVAHRFVVAYARTRACDELLNRWVENVSPQHASKPMFELVRHRRYAQVRLLGSRAPAALEDKETVAAALLTTSKSIDNLTFARALSRMPDLVNSMSFQQAWAREAEPRQAIQFPMSEKGMAEHISRLLEQRKVGDALNLLSEGRGGTRAFQAALRYATRTQDSELTAKLFACAQELPQEPSRYAHFILKYYRNRHDHGSALKAISGLPLERLNIFAWRSIWELLLQVSSRCDQLNHQLPHQFPKDLRKLLIGMSRSPYCTMDRRLLHVVQRVFEHCGDSTGAITIKLLENSCISEPSLITEQRNNGLILQNMPDKPYPVQM